MLPDLLSAAYLICFVLSGLAVARLVFAGERPLVRVWLGCVAALVMLLWFPALWAFCIGFTAAAQLLALVTAAGAGCACYLLARRRERLRAPWLAEAPLLYTLLPLFVLGVVLLSTHTIVQRDGALWVGQSTYGDLAMHLGFITSIAEQGTFPPMYSICPDTPVGYPFLSDSISATFYVLGADLRFAAMLPAMFAYELVLLGVYLFFERYLTERKAACLAALLFFVGSGFGFFYFFDLAQFQPDRLSTLFTAFYETPTNYPDYGLRWVNPIADMLIPQRATLFGWALLFPCLYLLLRGAFERDARAYLPLGVIAGALPLVHTHSFLALGIVSAAYLVRSLLRREGKEQLLWYVKYALIVAALALPQLLCFTFRQAGSFLRFNWNWDNVSDSFLWFYIKNWGLLFLLLPVAFLDASRRERAVFAGALAVWAVAELIQFQPNPYDNNKLLFVWFAFTCGIVANYLITTFARPVTRLERGKRRVLRGKTAGRYLLLAMMLIAMLLSGSLTLVREYISGDHIAFAADADGKRSLQYIESGYEVVPAAQVELAEWINTNTDEPIAADATFLTESNHNNAVAMLTGRNIFCGSGSFLEYHGVNYRPRKELIKPMYEQPETCLLRYAAEYDIDYVLVGTRERGSYAVDTEWFNANLRVVYRNAQLTVYKIAK